MDKATIAHIDPDVDAAVSKIIHLGRGSKDSSHLAMAHLLAYGKGVSIEKKFPDNFVPFSQVLPNDPAVEIQTQTYSTSEGGKVFYRDGEDMKELGVDPTPPPSHDAMPRYCLWIGVRHYPITRDSMDHVEFNVHLFRQRRLLNTALRRR